MTSNSYFHLPLDRNKDLNLCKLLILAECSYLWEQLLGPKQVEKDSEFDSKNWLQDILEPKK